jgi:hypothetical protein
VDQLTEKKSSLTPLEPSSPYDKELKVAGQLPVPAELPKDSAALANAAWKQPYVIPFWK